LRRPHSWTSGPPLGFDQFCAAWAEQFKNAAALGAPLLNALTAIETLARPENRHLLQEAQAKLPSGYEVISMALVNYGVLTRTVP